MFRLLVMLFAVIVSQNSFANCDSLYIVNEKPNPAAKMALMYARASTTPVGGKISSADVRLILEGIFGLADGRNKRVQHPNIDYMYKQIWEEHIAAGYARLTITDPKTSNMLTLFVPNGIKTEDGIVSGDVISYNNVMIHSENKVSIINFNTWAPYRFIPPSATRLVVELNDDGSLKRVEISKSRLPKEVNNTTATWRQLGVEHPIFRIFDWFLVIEKAEIIFE